MTAACQSTSDHQSPAGLSKRHGRTLAVNDLSFDLLPGRVTGSLAPNGAGKSTTMRMILGLDRPTSGTVTVDGRRYADTYRALHEVGAVLEARAMHGGCSAYNHLLCLAQSNAVARRRVSEVLDIVGLSEVAGKRARGFSLDMSQRLAMAADELADAEYARWLTEVSNALPDHLRARVVGRLSARLAPPKGITSSPSSNR